MRNEATIDFVRQHREDDVRTLALKARRDDVDWPWALDQIQGWQTARHKLPSWAATPGIVYPPHLSMEQCSSEATAGYKCSIIGRWPREERKTLIDLTGGFGVDFAFLAPHFHRAVYVERQEHLCLAARHNFQVLGLGHAQVVCDDAGAVLQQLAVEPSSTLLYLDPARRDSNSNRTRDIAHCTPNVLDLLPDLFKAARRVLVKLSPMLDWHKAVRDLGDHVAEVHIVSVAGECKELLILLEADHQGEPTVHCVNDDQRLIYTPSQYSTTPSIATDARFTFLYEPNAAVMAAGCFGVLTQRFPVAAIARDSHLFVSGEEITDFPGRRFAIDSTTTMNRKELAHALKNIAKANIAVRNFPMTAQQLRRRLRLTDGGETYIFGTTTAAGQHRLYLCHKQ